MSAVSKVFPNAQSVVKREFGSAIGVALGFAIYNFVRSIVAFLIMPLLDPVFRFVGNGYQWKETDINVGPFSLPIGALISETVSFLVFILGLYIFINVFQTRGLIG